MKRYYVLFNGRVQGVGFRWRTQELALKYGITGSVKNLYDGSVEAYFQGEKETILRLIQELKETSRWIVIEDYFMKDLPIIEDEKDFKVLF